ncbi:MAG: hypothetical protein AB7K24_04960 [Gemmataceae bacterium]
MFELLVALASIGAALSEAQVWHSDYASAQEKAIQSHKPLAVVFGSGKHGWRKLSRDGDAEGQIARRFASEYVCLYVDISTESGSKLARSFQIHDDLGIVISNRKGDLQAFRHEGELSDAALNRYLKRFADPDLQVTTTLTNPGDEERLQPYPTRPVQPAANYCPT